MPLALLVERGLVYKNVQYMYNYKWQGNSKRQGWSQGKGKGRGEDRAVSGGAGTWVGTSRQRTGTGL